MRIPKQTLIRYALTAAALLAVVVTVGALVPHSTADQLTVAAQPRETLPTEDQRAEARTEARLRAQQLARAAEAARAAKAEAARKAAAARAARSKARAAAQKKAAAARKLRAWVRPMRGELTSGFGYRWGSAHEGVDITGGGGTPVYAAASGVVAEARCTSPSCSHPGSMSMSGYGNKVDITHASGVMTRYAHLTRYVVRTGQRVTAGQLIGYEGATGNVTGAHLHFEVHIGGAAVNPIPFFAAKGVNLRAG